MKKLITICLIVAATFTVKAQDAKPTKEQTLAYLTKTFKLAEGEDHSQKGYTTKDRYTQLNFDPNLIEMKQEYYDTNIQQNIFILIKYPNIKWETVSWGGIDNYSDSGKVAEITLYLDSKVREIYIENNIDRGKFQNNVRIPILASKAESFKKALQRLVEIAKEENKNPFEK
jgi:hypothetical protein